MTIKLRWYQEEAVEAVFDYFGRGRKGNPLLELPTGAGKSFTQAGFIDKAIGEFPNTRIVCLAHVKELVQQNSQALIEYNPRFEFKTGVYSAGLRRREIGKQVVFGGIQSIYKKADELGWVDLLFIDEAHMVPHKGDGQYRQFIDALSIKNPNLKVIGMTATPYRLNGGMLTKGDDAIFSSIAYRADILRMIEEGWLSNIITHKGACQYDTTDVKVRGDDFVQSDLARMVESSDVITTAAVEECVALGNEQGRKHWLMFATSIAHATEICDIVEALGEERPHMVIGDTPSAERDNIIRAYKKRKIKCLVNVGVLTTGFNAPHVDLIGMLRPTKSPGLYVQILGRGLRTSEGKEDCLFLDYGENIERHGPINAIKPPKSKSKGDGVAPTKECFNCCYDNVPAGSRVCPECGYEFPPGMVDVKSSASGADVIRTDYPWFAVSEVVYRRHQKAGKPTSLKVEYYTGVTHSAEWVCLNHEGFAKRKADGWISRRTDDSLFPPIDNVEDALKAAFQIRAPCYIQINDDGKYDQIIGYKFEGDEPPEGKPAILAPTVKSDAIDSMGKGMNGDGQEEMLILSGSDGLDSDNDGFYDDDLPW